MLFRSEVVNAPVILLGLLCTFIVSVLNKAADMVLLPLRFIVLALVTGNCVLPRVELVKLVIQLGIIDVLKFPVALSKES